MRKRLLGILLFAAFGVPQSLPTQSFPEDTALDRAQIEFLASALLGAPFSGARKAPEFPSEIASETVTAHATAHATDLVAKGQMAFHDRSLSVQNNTSCADCHLARAAFSSPRVVDGRGVPSLYGAGVWRFLNADGSADSLVSQALGPLTHPLEMGVDCNETDTSPEQRGEGVSKNERGQTNLVTDRDRASHGHVAGIQTHCTEFLQAVAAYVNTLTLPPPAPLDVFAQAARRGTLPTLEPVLSHSALRGLKAFTTTAQCARCHFGPYLSNGEFHNVGVPATPEERPEKAAGRAQGLERLAQNPFRCETCEEWKHLPRGRTVAVGAFKTPTLRELSRTPPYMHNGIYQSIEAAVEHYAMAPEAIVGTSEAPRGPRGERLFSTQTQHDIHSFLLTLSSVGGTDRR